MDKSVFATTNSLIKQTQVLTTTNVRDIDVTFVVKLRGLKIENIEYKKLPLNEDDSNFEKQQNDINYKRTIMKIHDVGW